jgi:hypothetical protein
VTIRPEEIRAKLEAGRAAIAAQFRVLADEIDTLPLEGATDTLSWLGDHIERLLREAERILGADADRRQT